MSFEAPPPEVYHDCYVSPAVNFRLQDYTFEAKNCFLSHLRPNGGKIVHNEKQSEMMDISGCTTIEETSFYAGPLYPHFGHFLAESIHRLYALSVFPELKGATAYFHGVVRYGIMPWMYEICDLLDIERSAIRLIDKPYHFRKLYAPKQARSLASANFIPNYTKYFPAPVNWTRNGIIYMSRTKFDHNGGVILGERIIEKALQASGVRVIYPEDIGVRKTVAALRTTKAVIFSEGSSIHNVEAAGFQDCKVFMIGRRPMCRTRFEDVLASYFPQQEIYEDLKLLFSLDFVSGKISGKGCVVIDVHDCLSKISAFCGITIPAPSDEELAACLREDVLRFMASKNVVVGQPTAEEEEKRRSEIMNNPIIMKIMEGQRLEF